MEPELSNMGREMNKLSGVRAIAKDIEDVLRERGKKKIYDFGAGNPAVIPEVLAEVRKTVKAVSGSKELGNVLCRYGSSQGYAPFIKTFIRHMNRFAGWKFGEENVLVTPGSQTFFYYAANALAGRKGKKNAKILFPLMPDYTGYTNLGVGKENLAGAKPKIEITGNHEFKYRVDTKNLKLVGVGLVVFSRPCNPSGNVLHDAEAREIVGQAARKKIPVIIDSAYAPPIPNICYAKMKYIKAENAIHTFSFSKAGLAAARVGVAVGDKKLLEPMKAFQANACLSPPVFGQEIARRMIESGKLQGLCRDVVKPFYRERQGVFRKACGKYIDDVVPYYIHKSEGTFFAWLWFRGLPCSDWELFGKLKKEGVIVVPGSPFFAGESAKMRHAKECIRMSLAGSIGDIDGGVKRLASVVNRLYKN